MFQSLTDDFASSPPSKKPRGGDSSGKSRGKDAQMKCTTVKEIPKKQARSTFFFNEFTLPERVWLSSP